MKINCRRRWIALLLAPLALILTGCGLLCQIIAFLTILAFGGDGGPFGVWFLNAATWGAFGGEAATTTDPLFPNEGMLLTGDADGGESGVRFSKEMVGPFDACLSVSQYKPNKLLAYESRAELSIIRDAGETETEVGLEARMGLGGGFVVCAYDSTGVLSAPVWVESTSAVLRIEESDDATRFYARPAAGFGEPPPWQLVYEIESAPAATPYRIGYSGRALGKGGGFVYHALAMTGAALANETEAAILEEIGQAVLEFDRAEQELLLGVESDVGAASECLEAAMERLESAKKMVKEAGQAGALEESTEKKLTKKALKRSISKTTVGLKQGDKIEQGSSDDVKKMQKKVTAARNRAELAIANLFGAETKKSKKAANAIQISADD